MHVVWNLIEVLCTIKLWQFNYFLDYQSDFYFLSLALWKGDYSQGASSG
jgi:hypothetical protein